MAEDAVQESFRSGLAQNPIEFDQDRLGEILVFYHNLAQRRCLTLLRNSDREIAPCIRWNRNGVRRCDLELAYNRLERTNDLRVCLETLEPNRRMAILSSYVLGYSHGEIAGRMGAPLGSVKAWVRRGLLTLRECLS